MKAPRETKSGGAVVALPSRPHGIEGGLKLVRTEPSPDTIHALRQLLAAALRGEVVGLAAVALSQGNRYSIDVTGDLLRRPTFARGSVQALDDELRDLSRGVLR